MQIIAYSRDEIEADLLIRIDPEAPLAFEYLVRGVSDITTRLQLVYFRFVTGADTDDGHAQCFSEMVDFVAKTLNRLGPGPAKDSMAAQVIARCSGLAASFDDIEEAISPAKIKH